MSDEITKEVVEPASAPNSGEAKPVEIITPSEVIPEPIIQTIEPAVEPVIIPEPVFSPPVEPTQTPPVPLSGEAEIPNTPPSSGHLPLAGEEESTQAPIENPTPIVITPTPEPSPVVSPPVVSSLPAPLSTLDRISLAFKNNMLRARELLVKAHAVVSARRRKKIDSIMNLFLTKKKIKNSDVRDFLHIAEDTATNYLNILLKEGKIKRNGKSTGIYYTKV